MRYLSLIFIALLLSGCGALNFPILNSPKPPDQIYKYNQTIEKQPKMVQTPDGKVYIWEDQKQTVDVNYERKDKPLSWWQKFTNWLGNLGMIGFIALIIALFVAPGGTILWLWNQYMRFKKAFTQTVAAIDASNATQHPEVKAALSAKQDNDVKALVDDVQQPGK